MTCIVCQGEAADTWTVCLGCLNGIDDDLARIVELTRLAADALIRETKGSSNGTRSVPGSRPPLDVGALDAAMGLDVLPLLESWIRLIREEASLTAYGVATEAQEVTVGTSVGWLRSWLPWAAERVDFPLEELAREIGDAAKALERYNPDRGGRRDGVPVSCVADHPDADGRTCGYGLWTHADDTITCPRCLTRWTPDELLDAHDMDLLPAAVLILLDPDHPNPRKRIANWAARDRLTQHDSAPNPAGGPAVPLYRLGEYRSLIGTRIKEDTA